MKKPKTRVRLSRALATGVLLALTAAAAAAHPPAKSPPSRHTGTPLHAVPLDCDPDELKLPLNLVCMIKRHKEGHRLFTQETFGGNGRTCATCHAGRTGTLSPEDVRRLLRKDPDNPLFIHDGTDDGERGVGRILEHATVRITLPLPPNIRLKHDPDATEVTFLRGIPTTLNTPALDPVLMYDRRNESLEEQALGAIIAHARTDAVTPLELGLIADFQRNDRQFFSSRALYEFALTGTPPELPRGRTPAEKRGRRFFVDAPFDPQHPEVGICGMCHSGPMLNTANIFSTAVFGNPPFVRDHNVLVSERNVLGLPLMTFLIADTIDDTPVEVTTPDLGMLITPNERLVAQRAIPPDPVLAAQGLRRAFFANFFKIPSLWGIRHTAPYFHDNSAKTLEEVVDHYQFFFDEKGLGIRLSPRDKADMIAFMKRL